MQIDYRIDIKIKELRERLNNVKDPIEIIKLKAQIEILEKIKN